MGADRIICIRTDGNEKIAAGHLVRCLSIAENCLKAGMDVCFLLSDAESFRLLDGFMTEDIRKHSGLSVQVLKTARYDDPEKELPEVLSLLLTFSSQNASVRSSSEVVSAKTASTRSGSDALSAKTASTRSGSEALSAKTASMQSGSDALSAKTASTRSGSDALSAKTASVSETAEAISLSKAEPQPRRYSSVILLLDSYFVTENYLTAIGSVAKTAYLDDLQLFDYPVDLIINYDVISDHAMPSYLSAYRRAGKTLLGAAYTPLRSQFEDQKILVRENVSDILITTGGSDPYHFCVDFLQRLVKYNKNTNTDAKAVTNSSATISSCGCLQTVPTLHIVIGRLSSDRESLHCLAKEYPFVRLHENITDMAAFMSTCDLAVSAAGTTLYELCALGIPAISFTMADNQLAAANAFDETGAIPCAGDIRKEKDPMFHRIFDFLIQMQESTAIAPILQSPSHTSCGYQRRIHAHETMRKLVDGKGAVRIAENLRSL